MSNRPQRNRWILSSTEPGLIGRLANGTLTTSPSATKCQGEVDSALAAEVARLMAPNGRRSRSCCPSYRRRPQLPGPRLAAFPATRPLADERLTPAALVNQPAQVDHRPPFAHRAPSRERVLVRVEGGEGMRVRTSNTGNPGDVPRTPPLRCCRSCQRGRDRTSWLAHRPGSRCRRLGTEA